MPPDADVPETVVLGPVCGDGALDPGEECDDGNRENGDECDWLCRLGAGGFDYPPADTTLPPVVVSGPVREVVSPDEWPADGRGERPRLAWGADAYGVVYQTWCPAVETRIRILDRDGEVLATTWRHEEEWSPSRREVVWSGDRFGVFGDRLAGTSVWLATLDGRARELSPATDVFAASREYRNVTLGGASWDGSTFGVVAGFGEDAASVFHVVRTFSPAGVWSGLSVTFSEGWFLPSAEGPAIVGVPGGFILTDGWRIVSLDRALSVTDWSGRIARADHETRFGLHAPVNTGAGLLFLWLGAREGSTGLPPYDLWACVLDHSGRVTAPPRVVFPALATSTALEFRAAWGVAGTLVVFGGIASEPEGSLIRFLTTDSWGNVVSGPADLDFAFYDASTLGEVAVAADDAGYAVVVTATRDLGEAAILFRRLVPEPP